MLKNIKKLWGETDLIFDHNFIHIYYATIDKDKFSSKHYHRYKNNIIYVATGQLQINIWEDIGLQERILRRGDLIDIPSGQWHQFVANEPSSIVEIYYSKIDHEDIIRDI